MANEFTPRVSVGAAQPLAAFRAVEVARRVDIGDDVIAPEIVRDGRAVVAPAINKDKATDLISKLGGANRPSLPRVLTQSVAAGTLVSKGTVVNLILVPPKDINFSVFDQIHVDLQGRKLVELADFVDAPDVKQIIGQFAKPEDVPPEQKAILSQRLAGINVGVDDAVPGRTFADAYRGLATASAYR